MATIDRTTIVRGPCVIGYDSETFYSKGDVSLSIAHSTFEKASDAFGVIGRVKTDQQIVVEFEPVGEIEALAVLFPYGASTFAIGSSLYGASDKALTITSASETYTINNAAITQMPSIRATANNTAFGTVQFTGLLDLSGDPVNLSDYYSAAGAGGSLGTGFDPAKVITAPYTATLGSLSFMSEAGFDISFDLALSPVTVDGIGTVNMTLTNVGCSISCVPLGEGETDFDTFFDTLEAGEELTGSALDISTTTVGGLNFDVASVQVIDYQRRFGPGTNRSGTLNMQAKRTISTGALQSLFTVAAVV